MKRLVGELEEDLEEPRYRLRTEKEGEGGLFIFVFDLFV